MNTIAITPDFEKRVDELSRQVGQTKESFVKEILERELEDVEDLTAAIAISKRIISGEERTFSSKQVRKELGLRG